MISGADETPAEAPLQPVVDIVAADTGGVVGDLQTLETAFVLVAPAGLNDFDQGDHLGIIIIPG